MGSGRKIARLLSDSGTSLISALKGLGQAAHFLLLCFINRKLGLALLPLNCCWELRSVSGARATGVRTWRLQPGAM